MRLNKRSALERCEISAAEQREASFRHPQRGLTFIVFYTEKFCDFA